MKNLTFVCIAALCFTFGFSSCGEDEQDMIDFTIKPGQGIGTLKIGDLGNKVESELGQGFEKIVNVGTSGNATYNYFNDPKGIDIIFGQYGSGDLDVDTLPIERFYLFGDFDGMTAEGIKIGSSQAEVIAAYGEPDEVEFSWSIYNIGLVVNYNDMDSVRNIIVENI
ncbi:MAG: hypothetical protein P1U56_04805 [Saprospiraceae bacterium]|nr:hypothetical protein [Saprospiraceae bacterium]